MEFLIFAIIAFIVFIAAVISGMKEVEKKQTKGKENTSSQKQENSFTDIDSLDWDGFYERCRKVEEEREKAGRTCQSIDFRIAGTQYRSDEAIERANGLELFELLYLEWEKDNPQDPYAIKVLTDDGYHIGYMPAKYTKKFHSKINEYTECKVWDIKDQDYTDAPLIEVHAFFEWKKRIRKSSIKNNLEKGLE